MRIVILFFIFGTAMAVPTRSIQRIVGGESTTIETYPFMVNMQYFYASGVWSLRCGASLLSTRALLSAAHCYVGDLASSWRARVGTSFISTGGIIHNVASIVNHEAYNTTTYDNDVAVLKLQTPVTITESVGVAKIPGPFYNVPDDTVVAAVGWGRLASGGALPDQLQHVEFNVINQQECAVRYEYLKTQPACANTICPDVTDGMFCTGILDVGGKDSCQGDSGGPVVYSGDIIVGVTSWGYSCAHDFYPGVNARVSYFSNWISVHAAQV